MTRAHVHLRTCPLCESMCGLRVHVERGRVTKIQPNPDDVWSRGYICPKGTVLGHLHHDPDRLRQPRIRGGSEGEFRRVSWEEAFEEVERRLHPVIEKYGPQALTAYFGNPVAHNFSLSRYVAAFLPMSGIERIYSAGTIDQWPKNVSSLLLYGGMWTIPTPDLDRTRYLLMLGANPHASQGSLLAAPDLMGRLDALRARGGKLVVVDPRRTGTAEHADEWIAIRPGTDAALLLAMANVLFGEHLVRLGDLEGWVNGLDDVRRLCRDFPPAAVADACQVSAETIQRLARELSAAPAAAVYGRIGTCSQEFGTLTSWLVDALNILTGNLDRPGGSMFSNPIAPSLTTLPNPEFAEGVRFGRWRSRVRGAPEVLGQFPISCLAEEIATPGQGQIKALITIAGNPVLSAADSSKLDAALPKLECMIAVDNWLNETTRHAHVILPGLSVLEQPHYDDLLWSWAIRNAGKYSPRLFEPAPGRPEEWEILLTLAALCRGQPARQVDTRALDALFFGGLVTALAALPGSAIAGRDPAEITDLASPPGPERILDLQIRAGPWGDGYGSKPQGLSLDKLRALPNGIDSGPLEPRIRQILRTPSGKIELAPKYITADTSRLQQRLRRRDEGLVLISRRHVRSNNSWMHNVMPLMTGKERCTLLIHPADAANVGVVDGSRARITSKAGEVVAPVVVSDEMRRGVVCLPHGWGHDRPGIRLGVAQRYPGVCNNILAPGELVDIPSGNAVVNGIPVEVAPAESRAAETPGARGEASAPFGVEAPACSTSKGAAATCRSAPRWRRAGFAETGRSPGAYLSRLDRADRGCERERP